MRPLIAKLFEITNFNKEHLFMDRENEKEREEIGRAKKI